MNSNIGVSGSTLIDDTQIAECLSEIDSVINLYLNVSTNIVTSPAAGSLTKIEVDMCAMMILQGRHFRENNLVENVASMWSIVPDFTPAHLRMLEMIKQNNDDMVFLVDITTGANLS